MKIGRSRRTETLDLTCDTPKPPGRAVDSRRAGAAGADRGVRSNRREIVTALTRLFTPRSGSYKLHGGRDRVRSHMPCAASSPIGANRSIMADLVCAPAHSLVHQSLHATEAKTGTNGDGFGLGWYGERPEPGLYREIRPAWSDENLQVAHRAGALAPVLRPCPRLDRHRDHAGELPPLRRRAAPVHAQRPGRRLRPHPAPHRGPDPGRLLRPPPRHRRFGGDLPRRAGERPRGRARSGPWRASCRGFGG